MQDKKESPILILGNNMDRGMTAMVQERINRDYDICKLIRKGKGNFFVKLLTLSIAIFVFVYKFAMDNPFMLPEIVTPFSGFLFIYGAWGTMKEFPAFFEKSMNILSQIRYRFSKKKPRHPADLWSFLQGSLADVQMYNTTKQLLDKNEFEVRYGGEPYYELIYLDSIKIRWVSTKKSFKPTELIETWKHKRHYTDFYNKYSRRTFLAKAEDKYFKNRNKTLERSNSVFGISFSSEYFYDALISQNNFTIAGIDINMPKQEEKETYLVSEWLKYVLVPDIIDASKNEKEKRYGICVTDIQYGLGCETWSRWKEIKTIISKDIRIPIKRFIAIRKQNGQTTERFPVEKGREYISIGGAEQNLVLQSVINAYRWDGYKDFNITNKDANLHGSKLRVGFAENRFESSTKQDFLAGTEGLVYGVKDIVIGRLDKQNGFHYIAECFVMKFKDGTKVFSIYGFSAMATKMALVKYIEAREGETETFIPGKCQTVANILEYELIEASNPSQKIHTSPDGQYFDNNDLMNDVKQLNHWLKGEIPIDESAQCHIKVRIGKDRF